MGFHSFLDAKTQESIPALYASHERAGVPVSLFLCDAGSITGVYDGYGRLCEVTLSDDVPERYRDPRYYVNHNDAQDVEIDVYVVLALMHADALGVDKKEYTADELRSIGLTLHHEDELHGEHNGVFKQYHLKLSYQHHLNYSILRPSHPCPQQGFFYY